LHFKLSWQYRFEALFCIQRDKCTIIDVLLELKCKLKTATCKWIILPGQISLSVRKKKVTSYFVLNYSNRLKERYKYHGIYEKLFYFIIILWIYFFSFCLFYLVGNYKHFRLFKYMARSNKYRRTCSMDDTNTTPHQEQRTSKNLNI
jgi:hypothetical protein